MDLLNLITGVATNHDVLVYGLVGILACVFGPAVSIIGGILLRWEYFDFVPLYLILMAGELVGDVVWYAIGYRRGEAIISRFGKYFGITASSVARMKEIFHAHADLILVVSKLTTGFGFAPVVLLTAGIVRIPFRHYLLLNVIGQFVWTALLLSAGYWFAHLYATFTDVFSRMSLLALAVIVIFLAVRYAGYVRRRIFTDSNRS